MPDDEDDEVRLRTFASWEGGTNSDLLRLAVQHAAQAVGALGGLAHLTEPEEDTLRLVAATGLPRSIARPWESLPGSALLAPAQALREGRTVWTRALPSTPASEEGESREQIPQEWRSAGVLSVPVLTEGGPVGTISVVSMRPPPPGRRAFMATLAEAVAGRLVSPQAAPYTGQAPWWQEGSLPEGGRAMRAIRVGTWEWDVSTGLMVTDEVSDELARLGGLDPDTWDHRVETWMERVHPDDRSGVEEEISRSIASGGMFAVEYRVVDLEGHVSWVEMRGQFSYAEDGTPLRMTGHAWDVTQARSQLEWLTTLLELHPDRMYAFGSDDRVAWGNRAARRAANALGWDVLVGFRLWEIDPRLADLGLPDLMARARATGGAVVTHEFTVMADQSADRVSFEARAVQIGDHTAIQLVDVTEQRRSEEAAADQAARLSSLGGAMASALRARDVADAVERYVLPLVNASGLLVCQFVKGSATLVGASGYPDAYLKELTDLDPPQRIASLPVPDEPQFISSMREFAQLYPDLADSVRRGGKQSWALLPLTVAGERIGQCIVSWNRRRVLRTDERSLLITISGLVAQALERGRLYDIEHARAQEMRRVLEPRILPPLVAVSAVARHLPEEQREIGGAWYDAIPLPGARTALISGVITGRGMREAITMGQVRTTVAELTSLDYPLDELTTRISESEIITQLTQMEEGPAAALLLALYDATTGQLELASAAHPPPVLAVPGEDAQLCPVPVGPPLGTSPLPYEVTRMQVPPGVVLAFCTTDQSDSGTGAGTGHTGTAGPDEVVAGLLEQAARQTLPLERVCEDVANRLGDVRPDAGAALLLSRLERLPADRIAAWDLPLDPRSAGRARELAQAQLAEWGMEEAEFTAELAISELIGNTVRHASGPVRLRLLRLDESLIIEVYDGSQSVPHMQPMRLMAEHGRGLLLIGQVAAGWGSHYTTDGKCIWVALQPGEETPGAMLVDVDDLF